MQPIKKQLKKYVALCVNDAVYKSKFEKLRRVSKSEEWKIVVELLWMMKNEMAIELLQSTKYTNSSDEQKDITQKVYHNISEWIDFLTNPTVWVQKKGLLQTLTYKLKGEAKANPDKEKQNG